MMMEILHFLDDSLMFVICVMSVCRTVNAVLFLIVKDLVDRNTRR
jgi:hypothetical protein